MNGIFRRLNIKDAAHLDDVVNRMVDYYSKGLWSQGCENIWDALVSKGWQLGVSLPSHVRDYKVQ